MRLYSQELVAKSIESSDLNFSRYGDTFFEVCSEKWSCPEFHVYFYDLACITFLLLLVLAGILGCPFVEVMLITIEIQRQHLGLTFLFRKCYPCKLVIIINISNAGCFHWRAHSTWYNKT
jgi:hypothetical protein